MDFMATGLLSSLVPGATPKNPFSGLMALRSPLLSNLSHAMSSPTQVTSYPARLGHSMARLVFPQADGKAAQMYFLFSSVSPCGYGSFISTVLMVKIKLRDPAYWPPRLASGSRGMFSLLT